MNAEALDLPDGTFDRVLGHGILHHLDLSRALAEVRRVLKPTGRAVFVEPLGTNPLINLYRRLTPESRTVDERPLTRGDLALVRRTFPDATYRYFELTSLLGLAATAIGWEGGERLARYVLEPLDDWILNQLGGFRALAWQAVLTLPLS